MMFYTVVFTASVTLFLAALVAKAKPRHGTSFDTRHNTIHATNELFRICRMMWHSERIPPELVRGTFIMLHKKGSRDDMANYRAVCLLCHSYTLLLAVVARRLMAVLDERLPDTQAGFRPARGCRDNVPSDGSSTWSSGKEDKLSSPSLITVLRLTRRASYSLIVR